MTNGASPSSPVAHQALSSISYLWCLAHGTTLTALGVSFPTHPVAAEDPARASLSGLEMLAVKLCFVLFDAR